MTSKGEHMIQISIDKVTLNGGEYKRGTAMTVADK